MAVGPSGARRRDHCPRPRSAALLSLALALLAPAPAAAAIGDILVADEHAFNGPGGVIRVDPLTGVRSPVSSNGAPVGAPNFADPIGIALEADGDILVADWNAFGGSGGVIRVDAQTGARTAVSHNGIPGPNFVSPLGIAVAPDGTILVADPNTGGPGRVLRVDPQTGARTVVSQNGGPEGGPDFAQPYGLAVYSDGTILVADPSAFGGTGGLIRVNPQTGARTEFSSNLTSNGPRYFDDPSAIALEPNGGVLVADRNTFGGPGAVIRIDPQSGNHSALSANGQPAGGPDFSDPYGITLSPDGSILVSDVNAFSDSGGGVIRVDAQTGVRTAVSANGAPAGGPTFVNPWGIAISGAPPPPPPPPPPRPIDRFEPTVTQVTLTNARFVVGAQPTPVVARRVPVGTTFRYTLSEAAIVRVVIERALAGRRVGRRCRKARRRLRRRPRCTRYLRAGRTLTRVGRPGRNRLRFSGRIGRRKLRPGRYRARFSATDGAGNRSRTVSVRFRVVRR